MAAWLRMQNSTSAQLLADAIERGDVVDVRPVSQKKVLLRWQVGKWISDEMTAGVPYESAIAAAAFKFPVSQRTAERCKSEWDLKGSDAVAALRFLSPLSID